LTLRHDVLLCGWPVQGTNKARSAFH
jgi:hypothetical protein